jgi:ribosomal protein S18 acetylase RimI-like enzyme
MTNIIIKETDLKEAALSLASELTEFFNKEGVKSLENDLKSQNLYGAFIKDDLIGFIVLRKADTASLEISWLAVKTGYQRQGIGSKLVKSVLDIFANNGYKLCYVKTLAETVKDDGYSKTRSFYKKLGFNTLEIISPYPGWTKDNPCQILATPLPLK